MIDRQFERNMLRALASRARAVSTGRLRRASGPRECRARLQERVGHRAADQQRVDFAEQVLDDFEFVRHLGAAENGDKRAIRIVERLAEIFHFVGHEKAGDRIRHVMHDAFGGRMRAMRRAERVVHIHIAERRELLGKRRIVGFFFGVKAQVLEQNHAAGVGRDRLLSGRAHTVTGEGHGSSEQFRQMIRDRLECELVIDLALGTAKVRGQNDRRTLREGVGDGRQSATHTRVVADHPILDRNVEVDAHKYALAFQHHVANRARRHSV
jgi:hypothetical protein